MEVKTCALPMLGSQDNTVTTLAADAAALQFKTSGGFAVGTVNTAGITTTGDTTLGGGGTGTQLKAISALGLELKGGGTFQRGGQDKTVTTRAADAAAVQFKTSGGGGWGEQRGGGKR